MPATTPIEELHQHTGAALRVGRRPGRMRCLGGFDGEPHLGLAGERDTAENGAVHRLEKFRRTARCAGNMLAANEMSDFLHDLSSRFDKRIMRYKNCIAM